MQTAPIAASDGPRACTGQCAGCPCFGAAFDAPRESRAATRTTRTRRPRPRTAVRLALGRRRA